MLAFVFLSAFDCNNHDGGTVGYRRHLSECGRQEAIALGEKLIAFPTVNNGGAPATTPAFTDMENFLRAWAKENDLQFSVSGARDAWQITLGDGATLALIAHGDVQPADPKTWAAPPFSPHVAGEALFGRGAEDDKGPLAAAMVAVAQAKAFHVPLSGVRIVIGTAEESSWDGMKRYAALPEAKYNVSIDGSFPVVTSQFGFVAWHLRVPLGAADGITKISAGEFLTQVPGRAEATIENGAPFLDALQTRAQKLGVNAAFRSEGQTLFVSVTGKTAHSSEPEEGDNALIQLAQLLRRIAVPDNGYKKLVDILADDFTPDVFGVRLGLSYSDPQMGALVVAPTLLREDHGWLDLGVNLRRPRGKTNAEFRAMLHTAAQKLGIAEGEVFIDEPHVSENAALVETLLDIYRTHEKNPKARAVSERGGTYARLFKGGVDFGPSFPKEPYTGHGDNEHITFHQLSAETEMLGEVIMRLAFLRSP